MQSLTPRPSQGTLTACLARASGVTGAKHKALSASSLGTQTKRFKPGQVDQSASSVACSSKQAASSCFSSPAPAMHGGIPCLTSSGTQSAAGHVSGGGTSPQTSGGRASVYRSHKRKKREPYAPPSSELLAKLTAKFPKLSKPRTGDG